MSQGVDTRLCLPKTAWPPTSDDTVLLKIEVPGLEPKDINVEVTSDSVSISGERKSETTTEVGS